MSYQTIDNKWTETSEEKIYSENRVFGRSSHSEHLNNGCRHIKFIGIDFQMNKTQFITIILLIGYFFLSASYYSLFAPFFPSEAVNKNLSKTQIGIIFSMFELVIFILSPYFGKNVKTQSTFFFLNLN